MTVGWRGLLGALVTVIVLAAGVTFLVSWFGHGSGDTGTGPAVTQPK